MLSELANRGTTLGMLFSVEKRTLKVDVISVSARSSGSVGIVAELHEVCRSHVGLLVSTNIADALIERGTQALHRVCPDLDQACGPIALIEH